MKLTKLSLAVMVALGTFSVTASAIPLEDAIKDVDVSGYLRYRYTYDDDESKDNESKGEHGFKGVVNFKAALDDNFFTVVGLQYDSRDPSGEKGANSWNFDGKASSTEEDYDDFKLRQALLGYTIGNTTIMAGRQEVGAFFTDDMVGDGIKVLNQDIEGLTLAAMAFDNLDNDSDIATLNLGKALYGPKGLLRGKPGIDAGAMLSRYRETNEHNLYGVAAIGSYDPLSFQLWYASLIDVTDLFAAELAFNFDLDPVMLGVKAQYAFSSVDGDFEELTSNLADDAQFYAAELTAEVAGFDLSAGYINFEADSKDKVSVISYEDQGAFISPGEELLDYTLFEGENWFWFAGAGYTFFDKLRIGGEYIDGENKTNAGTQDQSEWVARIDYAHSKNLKFKTWYSQVNYDGAGEDYDDNRFRFEAKYSF
ncbi:MAG: major outer membrane protein [Campylobacter sputorum]|uniref:major outer membrane protein n=1 Tax=Campylobacter sputorum TaxID=206 RepID=UPI000B787460|nr:major outer membrane protein [Campylobacter sputorum]ASM39083.1 major outer membrane protein [Campylobacter sputorum bv. paraureolyticus LMG 11764]MDY6120047.1 major outer membrane protein [Campylobacter sputorum]